MGQRIILIDDDPDIIQSMKVVLEGEGYEVETARNSTEGIEKIRVFKPQLIILDVMMNTKDEGFQAAYKMKADSEIKKIPIVMITSVGQITGFEFDKEKDGDFIQAEEFVEKPVKAKQLLEIVKRNILK